MVLLVRVSLGSVGRKARWDAGAGAWSGGLRGSRIPDWMVVVEAAPKREVEDEEEDDDATDEEEDEEEAGELKEKGVAGSDEEVET